MGGGAHVDGQRGSRGTKARQQRPVTKRWGRGRERQDGGASVGPGHGRRWSWPRASCIRNWFADTRIAHRLESEKKQRHPCMVASMVLSAPGLCRHTGLVSICGTGRAHRHPLSRCPPLAAARARWSGSIPPGRPATYIPPPFLPPRLPPRFRTGRRLPLPRWPAGVSLTASVVAALRPASHHW